MIPFILLPEQKPAFPGLVFGEETKVTDLRMFLLETGVTSSSLNTPVSWILYT